MRDHALIAHFPSVCLNLRHEALTTLLPSHWLRLWKTSWCLSQTSTSRMSSRIKSFLKNRFKDQKSRESSPNGPRSSDQSHQSHQSRTAATTADSQCADAIGSLDQEQTRDHHMVAPAIDDLRIGNKHPSTFDRVSSYQEEPDDSAPPSGTDIGDQKTADPPTVESSPLATLPSGSRDRGMWLWDAAYDRLIQQHRDMMCQYEGAISSYINFGDIARYSIMDTTSSHHQTVDQGHQARKALMDRFLEAYFTDPAMRQHSLSSTGPVQKSDDGEPQVNQSSTTTGIDEVGLGEPEASALREKLRAVVMRSKHASIAWGCSCLTLEVSLAIPFFPDLFPWPMISTKHSADEIHACARVYSTLAFRLMTLSQGLSPCLPRWSGMSGCGRSHYKITAIDPQWN